MNPRRLKQWMNNLPRVLRKTVDDYLDYANWIVHLFPPGVWEELCPMLNLGVSRGSFTPPVPEPILARLQTNEMHTIPFQLFMKVVGAVYSGGWCVTTCGEFKRLLDLVARGGRDTLDTGYMQMTVCPKGHFSFAWGKKKLSAPQYIAIRKIEHQMVLVGEQEDDVPFINRRRWELRKEIEHLLKSWYPTDIIS